MYKTLAASLIFFALLLSGCKDKKTDTTPVITGAHSVFVVCEGSLGQGSSALTMYDPDSNQVIQNVFGRDLGDIFQSITPVDSNTYYLAINNSDRITVVRRSDLSIITTIAVPKPRYVLPLGQLKAYVSTLFSNKVFVLNAATHSVIDTIQMPFKNPEGMTLYNNKAYICTWDSACSAICRMDILKDSVEALIPIPGRAPQEVLADAEGMLWVLSGNKAQGVEARLTRLDPATGVVLQSFSFGPADPLRLVANRTLDTLYFIEVDYRGGSSNNGVYRMGIHDAGLPIQPFVAAHSSPDSLQYFWGVGINPRSGDVYVADPKGFTQKGQVFIYHTDGSFAKSFYTGIGPGHFYFE